MSKKEMQAKACETCVSFLEEKGHEILMLDTHAKVNVVSVDGKGKLHLVIVRWAGAGDFPKEPTMHERQCIMDEALSTIDVEVLAGRIGNVCLDFYGLQVRSKGYGVVKFINGMAIREEVEDDE